MRLSDRAARTTGLALAVLVAGCVTPAKLPGGIAPGDRTVSAGRGGSLAANHAGNLVANNGGTLVANQGGLAGVVRGPGQGLIGNHVAGLLASDFTGFLSDRGGGIGAGTRFVLLQADTRPAARATITIVDERDQPLAPVVTAGEDGRYEVPALAPSGAIVFVKATYTQEGQALSLLAAAPAPRTPGLLPVPVDPSTSLVAKKVVALAAAGKLGGRPIDAEAIAAVAREVAPVMSPKALVAAALGSGAIAAKAFDALLEESEPLAIRVAEKAQVGGAGALVGEARPADPGPGQVPAAGSTPPPVAAQSPPGAVPVPPGERATPTPVPTGLTPSFPRATPTLPTMPLPTLPSVAPPTPPTMVTPTPAGATPTPVPRPLPVGATPPPAPPTANAIVMMSPASFSTRGVNYWKQGTSTQVTLMGTFFSTTAGAYTIRIGDFVVPAADMVSVSATMLVFKVSTAVDVGSWPVKVTVGGVDSNAKTLVLDDGGWDPGGCPLPSPLCP